MMLCETPNISRRRVLGLSGTLVASAFIPKFARAGDGRDPRLIAIILRGAMDGLSAVAPVGDPAYAALHGDLALQASGAHAGIALDAFFALNPAMQNFARLYKAGQAAVVHACATGYRDRSHFDGQDILESGFNVPGHVDSGWLNRAIAAIPTGQRIGGKASLAVGPTAPLIMRGQAPIIGWSPNMLKEPTDDLGNRLLDLYQHTDKDLAAIMLRARETSKITEAAGDAMKMKAGGAGGNMQAQARGAALLMSKDDGPRIAAMAFDGWDTHQNEGGATGRLYFLLKNLDAAIGELEKGLGADVWRQTTVVVMTEFGRTVKVNGTEGTDHGTGTVALLAGGAVKGGRVIADWPGLSDAALHEGRDLKATTDLRSVLKGLLADKFGLSSAVLATDVFPGSGDVGVMKGLVTV